jgi:hypothetical protein
VRDMGYAWPSVNGFEYWAYEDRKLTSLTVAEAD